MQTQRQKKTRNGSENNIFRVSFLDGQLGITKIKYTNIHLKVFKIYILRNRWGEIGRGLANDSWLRYIFIKYTYCKSDYGGGRGLETDQNFLS